MKNSIRHLAAAGFFIVASLAGMAQTTSLKTLNILYTNDLHAHLEPHIVGWIHPSRPIGGFANISTLVKTEKKKYPGNTLYLDAGDFFTGPVISTLTKGAAIIDVLNTMQLDMACMGNHEFDHGWENAIEQTEKAGFPILNGNIFYKGTDRLVMKEPYRIITVNGIRIGIIGLHGKFAFYDTTADIMIQGIEAKDEEEYLKKYLALLKPATDLIILLVHEGVPGRQSSTGSVDVKRNLQKDIELAQRVPGVDIMITGHAHQGTPDALVSNGTLIVSTDALGIELGKLELSYDPTKDSLVSYKNKLQVVYDDEIPDDSLTQSKINEWKQKLLPITEKVISHTKFPLTRSYGEESYLANLFTDAMRTYSPGAELALLNSGSLRQDIDAGDISVGDIISAFPFPNTLVSVELTGASLMKLFEHGASLTNGILQVSNGVVLKYDTDRPIGQRVVFVTINGQPLKTDKVYKVVTSSFLADGGDGFLELKQASKRKDLPALIIDAVFAYLKDKMQYQPVLEGRVKKANY